MEDGNFDYENGLPAIPEHFFNEDGELDFKALLEAVHDDPQLLESLQALYSDPETMKQPMMDHTLASLFEYCVIPSIQSIADTIFWLILACILCNLISRLAERTPRLVHLTISLIGLLLLVRFFAWNTVILVVYAILSGMIFLFKFSRLGVLMSTFTVLYGVLCELFVEPVKWHNVRGAQIVMSMKAISLAFDTDKDDVEPATVEEYGSYMLNPVPCYTDSTSSLPQFCSHLDAILTLNTL